MKNFDEENFIEILMKIGKKVCEEEKEEIKNILLMERES